MSRTFLDSLEADVESVFLNVHEFAQAVTLSRGVGHTTASVPAIVEQRDYQAVDQDGMATLVEMVDFDIAASAYLVDAVAVEPRTGDRIATADGQQFEVGEAPGRGCWDYAGGDKLVMRVHTRRVK